MASVLRSPSFDDVRVRTNDTQFNEYNPGTAQATITDATVVEGASGNTIVTLMISLSQALAQTATVMWATGPSTALAGSDFVAASAR